jgi:hypothetical protein
VIGIPDVFNLVVGGGDERHFVDVAWRKPNEMGVHFAR